MKKNPSSAKSSRADCPEYLARKSFFDQLITVYGRKPVLEALQDQQIKIFRVHLADSNCDSDIIVQIKALARERNVEVCLHNRRKLSQISRNSKQDQGAACDIYCRNHGSFERLLQVPHQRGNLSIIAVDGITNPQNLGMIIRSVTASSAHGLLLPSKGNADISPLVIKASAGTLFRGNILRCGQLSHALRLLQQHGFKICAVTSHQATPIADFSINAPVVFVLGNETHGLSREIMDLSDCRICIPMANGVESLNVAVTAALIAFTLC